MSYSVPSWMWDSPDGRAYSYYRQSFLLGNGGKEFYSEFLVDYDPNPTIEDSGLFAKNKLTLIKCSFDNTQKINIVGSHTDYKRANTSATNTNFAPLDQKMFEYLKGKI